MVVFGAGGSICFSRSTGFVSDSIIKIIIKIEIETEIIIIIKIRKRVLTDRSDVDVSSK